VVGLGLIVSMVLASVFGTLVPIILQSVKVDPAVATGPLVTTSMDVLAFGTYLSLAAWLLMK
jgi:magnesium transporter